MAAKMYRFTVWDYAIVTGVLAFTAVIGFYYVWKAQRSKNTREFLVANKSLGMWPLVLSAVATSLSSGNLLGTPMQAYSNGVQMATGYIGFFAGLALPAYTTMPVLYRLNVNTVNQYVEYRFNRFLRVFPAFVTLFQTSFIAAGITYVTALVFSQATGLHLGASLGLLGGLCIVYSSLGGFTAVIWTDVFQVVIIFATFALLAIKGTIDAGGVGNVWEKNRLGNRTTFAYFSPVPHSGYTFWSLVIGEFGISFCVAAGSQAQLQRQVANKSITRARMTVFSNALITQVLSMVAVWIGMAAYARYYRCDPVLAGEIESIDQIISQFAMDMFDTIPSLSGLYVAGILCATLSTLSSYVNSFSAVVLIDFIKPLMPNTPDSTTKWMAKIIGMLYGIVIMGMSSMIKYLGNLIPVMHTIGGTGLGITTGIYVLGFFFPWATAKGTTIGYTVSLVFGLWLAIGRILIGNPYMTAPFSADGCNATHIPQTESTTLGTTIAPTVGYKGEESSSFALHDIIPVWYASITLSVCVITGLIASIITGPTDLTRLDPNLISPAAKYVLRKFPRGCQKRLGLVKFLKNNPNFAAQQTELQDLNDMKVDFLMETRMNRASEESK